MIHYIIIYLKLTKTIKRYKRFWTRCKNIKTDSLKFLESIPGNRDSTDVKTDNSRLFSDIWSTSGPRYLEVLSKTCMSQRQAGNGRKWTRDDFGLGKANHDKSRIITRKRDLKSLKTIKIFWIYFYNFRIPFFLSKKLWILLHIIYFGIIWSLELT